MDEIAQTTLNQAYNPEALSLLSLFYQADIVVKAVMIGLVILSIISWAVIIDKYRLLKKLHKRADTFDELFWSNLDKNILYEKINQNPKDPLSMVFITAMKEYKLNSSASLEQKTLKIHRAMQATINRQWSFLEKNIIILSSTASASPFIGLFGTVWGIMNSFTAIAGAKQASISVVAPGIAEALLATAIGLIAAIPATVFYNKISNDIDQYLTRLETFQDEFITVMER